MINSLVFLFPKPPFLVQNHQLQYGIVIAKHRNINKTLYHTIADNYSSNNMKYDSLLILNSDKSLIRGVTVALIDYFSEVRATTNPKEAMLFLKNKNFTTIITGTDFLTDDGLEIIRELRKNNPFAKLLVVTSPLDEEVRKKIEMMNIQKIYEKPFDLQEIISDIKKMIN